MPNIRKERYIREFNIPEYDAIVLTMSKHTAKFFEKVANICKNPKIAANWIMGDFARLLNETEISITDSKISEENLAELIMLIDKGTISTKIAKTVFEEMFETGEMAEKIVNQKGLVQISDESAVKEIVTKIVENNPQSVIDYNAGRDRALGYLVGQVMKETKGKANPNLVNKLLLEILNNAN